MLSQTQQGTFDPLKLFGSTLSKTSSETETQVTDNDALNMH